MRIAFLHACLEPGRDGVGDYTEDLAAECARQNTPASALALRDPFVTRESEGERAGVPILRLPRGWPWRERIQSARRFLDRQAPDWVSLQFVPYAYNERGLVFGLARRLSPLFQARRPHIMFHELWIGRKSDDPLKERLVGWVQRALVARLAGQIRFQAAHTSNPYYLSRLRRAGISAMELPLFGAVAPVENAPTAWLYNSAREKGWPLTPSTRGRFLLFGMFGSIHPVWPVEPLLSQLAEAGDRLGRRIGILSIGRQGPGEALWDRMAAEHADRCHFLRLGERPEESVSAFLQFVDYGVATTPYALIGKSASAVAMIEHGLPVIVNRDEIPFDGEPAGPDESRHLLIRATRDLPEILAAGIPRKTPSPRLPRIAARFLRDLQLSPGRQEARP